MQVVRCDDAGLHTAAEVVRRSGTVSYPTDTVYGLGCGPFDARAVETVFRLKGREEKPMPVLCAGLEVVERLVELEPLGRRLASRFWPGPLTVVAPLKAEGLPPKVTAHSGKLGVRIPNYGCTLRLLELCGGSLIGTSANRSGLRPPKTPREVLEHLGEDFDVLVDGGRTPLGGESTVIELSKDGVRLIREGVLKFRSVLAL